MHAAMRSKWTCRRAPCELLNETTESILLLYDPWATKTTRKATRMPQALTIGDTHSREIFCAYSRSWGLGLPGPNSPPPKPKRSRRLHKKIKSKFPDSVHPGRPTTARPTVARYRSVHLLYRGGTVQQASPPLSFVLVNPHDDPLPYCRDLV